VLVFPTIAGHVGRGPAHVETDDGRGFDGVVGCSSETDDAAGWSG
jgi:hypothetical protein